MSTRFETIPRSPSPAARRPELFWQAVLERDSRYDGVFYYAVSTTGVFCRPVCPSRRPRPEHVTFFHAAGDAARQGFRPCKRCRPDRGGELGEERRLVLAACRAIEGHDEGAPTLDDLGRQLGLGADRVRQLFRRVLGVSPKQYADAVRVLRFKRAIETGENVTNATYEAGFGSSSRIYERAGRHLGMTPATYRRRGAGEQVWFASWASPLGSVLVAATERGICSVKIGPSPEPLEAELELELGAAELHRSAARIAPVRAALEGYLSGSSPLAELPIDVTATAFQARVWAALRAIPPGQTRTYGEVARDIGSPRAVRAVANACARNPVALLVPCHRVVPRGAKPEIDGDAGGYRWGREVKRALLALESGCAAAPETGDGRER